MSNNREVVRPERSPQETALPRHLAIVMDGNGRWAQGRRLPRPAGHRAGVEAVRRTVEACARRGIQVLTLFAFSSENWTRPPDEVSMLMELFLHTLEREVGRLHQNDVRVRLIGDRSRFSERLCRQLEVAERLTAGNRGLHLVIAASYGGRWDITEAARRLAAAAASGELEPEQLDESRFRAFLSTGELPDPDLLIRTGGERRISNFLLWQLAYAELYFSPTLWPDFDEPELERALAWYAGRERRFGRTSDQIPRQRRA